MAINFPTSPSEGDQYTYEGRTWRFDGTAWVRVGKSAGSVFSAFSFTGDGSTTAFDLTDDIPSLTSISDADTVMWFEDGIWQRPGADFTISGTVVTRTTAPANGAVIAGVLIESLGNYSAAPFDVDDLTNIAATSRDLLTTGILTSSWTPSVGGSSSNPTVSYSNQQGSYTRIGSIVVFRALIVISSISGGSGNVRINGFPFTAQGYWPLAFYADNWTYPASVTNMILSIQDGTTQAKVFGVKSAASGVEFPVANVGNGNIIFSGVYVTSDP